MSCHHQNPRRDEHGKWGWRAFDLALRFAEYRDLNDFPDVNDRKQGAYECEAGYQILLSLDGPPKTASRWLCVLYQVGVAGSQAPREKRELGGTGGGGCTKEHCFVCHLSFCYKTKK